MEWVKTADGDLITPPGQMMERLPLHHPHEAVTRSGGSSPVGSGGDWISSGSLIGGSPTS